MRAAAAILAAGQGTRFGGTKQLADLDGRPLVVHAVEGAMAAGLDPVLVVTGHDARAVGAVLPDAVVVVPNPWYSEGQATSLHAAVEAATSTDAELLVVLLGDEPGVDPAVVRDVVRACEGDTEAARAMYADRPGHPVALTRAIWPRLLRTRGDTGARPLLDDLDLAEVQVATSAPVDIDTRDDLDDVRRDEAAPSGGP